jgi:hypothetical protein
MALTIDECRIAAQRAMQYPPESGDTYLAGLGKKFLSSYAATDHLKLHPQDVDKGCPAVAVAAARGKLTSAFGLLGAFADVFCALNMTCNEYCKQLSASPEEIAKRLTLLAEQGSND